MNRRTYPTDLIDPEWTTLERQFPVSPYGRDELHPVRKALHYIYYQARSGCAWHLMPHDSPLCTAAYSRFRRWVEAGTWERANVVYLESGAGASAGGGGQFRVFTGARISVQNRADISGTIVLDAGARLEVRNGATIYGPVTLWSCLESQN